MAIEPATNNLTVGSTEERLFERGEALARIVEQWEPKAPRPHPTADLPVVYQLGALSVRGDTAHGFVVHFEYGSDSSNLHTAVPHRGHPLGVGREHNRDKVSGFRTKTAARAYMTAVADSGILPTNRPATRAEIAALRDWLMKAAA